MKKWMIAAALICSLSVAAASFASPIVTAVPADSDPGDPDGFGPATGAGLHALDVYVSDPGNPDSAWGIDLTFTGNISQLQGKPSAKAALQNINDDTAAANADGRAGTTYLAANDSFFFAPWPTNLLGAGITQAANSYEIVAGSGLGQTFGKLLVARIVYSGNTAPSYSGVLAHPTEVPVSGVLSVPEPTTWALLGLGVCGMVPLYRARRRARQHAG